MIRAEDVLPSNHLKKIKDGSQIYTSSPLPTPPEIENHQCPDKSTKNGKPTPNTNRTLNETPRHGARAPSHPPSYIRHLTLSSSSAEIVPPPLDFGVFAKWEVHKDGSAVPCRDRASLDGMVVIGAIAGGGSD